MDHISRFWARTGSKSGAAHIRALLLGCTTLSASALWAETLPTAPTIVGGQADVAVTAPGQMQINQTSNRAVVNWDSFSIGEGNAVNITQPGQGSAILNRVTGHLPSTLNGSLSATGQVFVINRSGVLVGENGRVDASGFVASTLDIADSDFMTGQLVFEGDGGTVRNDGQINIRRGGFAALLGSQVTNTGTITVPMGYVGLGAGKRATLDFTGDQFLQVALPADGDPNSTALIENSGRITADGGRVEMRVASAREAVRNTINLSGVVQARTVSGRNGSVVLGGGGGTVTVTGRVDASARAPAPVQRVTRVNESPFPRQRPQAGGDVLILGGQVFVQGATIDASGLDGGGEIRIGGDYQGGGDLPQAQRTWIDERSSIYADALHMGDGGTVIVWATDATGFAGQISARGGADGGDGGFAEVSGKARLSMTGAVDLSAPQGETGVLLLDPFDVTISDDPTTGYADISSSTRPQQQPSNINNAELSDLLDDANVFVTTTNFDSPDTNEGFIDVQDPISWTSENILGLTANGRILIDAAITAPNGRLFLTAGSTIEPSAAAEINVDLFRLFQGDWEQVGALSNFAAADFAVSTVASFLRAASGDGADQPYEIVDVYGLQGVGSGPNLASNYVLGADINAAGVSNWNFDFEDESSRYGWEPIHAFNGTLDGDGFTISNLSTDLISSRLRGDTAMFLSIGSDAIIRDLTLEDVNMTGEFSAGLALTNNGTIEDVAVSGLIRGTSRALFDSEVLVTSGGVTGGVVATNGGNINGVSFEGRITGIEQGRAMSMGAIAGLNLDDGVITASESDATITVTSSIAPNEANSVGRYGGLVGYNVGEITTSRVFGLVNGVSNDDNAVIAGGLVGDNDGTITQSASETSVIVRNAGQAFIGGLVGRNSNVIADAYARGTVTDDGNNNLLIAGLVGGSLDDTSDITNTYATGRIEATNSATVIAGGLIGRNAGQVRASFWDTDTTGQDVSGGGTPLTTAELQNRDDFIADTPWDFAEIWAPPFPGFYPELYAVSPVLFANPDNATVDYGTAVGTTLTGSVNGGPKIYAFGPDADSIDTSDIFAAQGLGRGNVGTYTILGEGPVTSDLGINYRVVSTEGFLTVRPIALLVQADDRSKVYGDALALGTTAISVTGLVLDDTVTGATLTDLDGGAPATAQVSGNPYAIGASAATGTNLGNYTITYQTGDLTIDRASLRITADDQSKVYGTTATLGTTAFSVDGLLNADSVASVVLDSPDGAPDDATVDGSPYAIAASGPNGVGLDNYDISFVNGALTVTPARLTVTAGDTSKTYGDIADLDAVGFEVVGFLGLVDGEQIIQVTLNSDGIPVTAGVGTYAIEGSDAVGTGLTNYTINYADGALQVDPRALTITVADQAKIYGDAITATTDFAQDGLINGDTVSAVSVTSDGTPGTAVVGLYDLVGTDAEGTGLANYTIAFVDGTLRVDPRALTIAVTDQTKIYGDVFTTTSDFDPEGLVNDDSVDTISVTSDGAAATAVTGNYDLVGSNAAGSGLENYTISFANGTLEVDPRDLVITLADQTKTYGEQFRLAQDFNENGLVNDDTIDAIAVNSDGSAATANVGEYSLIGSDAEGTGLDNYFVIFTNGALQVIPAPLVIAAGDQSKDEGDALDLGQTEFDVTGLLNDDAVAAVTLQSEGADAAASADGSPYQITASDAQGDGLSNYDIAYQNGALTVDEVVGDVLGVSEVFSPLNTFTTIPNPQDEISFEGVLSGLEQSPSVLLRDARLARNRVAGASGALAPELETCRQSETQIGDYMACVIAALDDYADALDALAADLPPELANVGGIIRDLRDQIENARATAIIQLRENPSPAARRRITANAIATARSAVQSAQAEIRSQISLIRAADSELTANLQQTGAIVINTLENMDGELARAIDL